MNNKGNLVKAIKSSVKDDSISDINQINVRECESDNYSGFSMTITGNAVPIRPMIESVELFDDWRVENIGMYSDVPVESEEKEYEHGVTMFCAYIGKKFDNNIFT